MHPGRVDAVRILVGPLPPVVKITHFFTVAVILIVAISALAAGPLPPEKQDHQHPAVLRMESGEQKVDDAEKWAARRQMILEGAQQVMGKLPDRAKLPPLDVKIGDGELYDGFTRVPLT